MVVPEIKLAAVFTVVGPENVDESSAGFRQTSRQQKALSVFVPPVTVTQRCRFLVQVEGASYVCRRDQVECLVVVRTYLL